MIPQADDVAGAALFDPVVAEIDALTADDPDGVVLIESGELRRLRRLIVVRQEMLVQGLHREEAGIEGVRAKYSDDARAAPAADVEIVPTNWEAADGV